MKWPATEGVFNRVGVYASMLAAAKRTVSAPGAHIEITDEMKRDDASMLELLDYLTSGSLPYVRALNWPVRKQYLTRCWFLCNFANELKAAEFVEALQARMVKHLSNVPRHRFMSFAEFCCRPGQSLKTNGGNKIGRWMKSYMKLNMRELDGGDLDRVKRREGPLKDLLMEALLEKFRERL